MDRDSAIRLKNNEDYIAFIKVLQGDIDKMKEELVSTEDVLHLQKTIQGIRYTLNRLDFIIQE